MPRKKKPTGKYQFTPQQIHIIRRKKAIVAAQKENVSAEKTFKLPLKNGGHRWNIFRVSNVVLNGKRDGDVHGGLVLDEENENVMLVEVTHSPKHGKRNNIQIRNLNSQDLDENGNLRESYLERRLIVSYKKGSTEEGIDLRALNRQLNDLQFTEEEKQTILDELSRLSTAEERYRKFLDFAKKKNGPQ